MLLILGELRPQILRYCRICPIFNAPKFPHRQKLQILLGLPIADIFQMRQRTDQLKACYKHSFQREANFL